MLETEVQDTLPAVQMHGLMLVECLNDLTRIVRRGHLSCDFVVDVAANQ